MESKGVATLERMISKGFFDLVMVEQRLNAVNE